MGRFSEVTPAISSRRRGTDSVSKCNRFKRKKRRRRCRRRNKRTRNTNT